MPMHPPDGEAEARASEAETLRKRHLETGNRQDIDEAVRICRQLLAVATDQPTRALRLFRLGTTLSAQYEASGNPEVLDDALAILDETVRLLPADHEDFPTAWTNAGMARLRLFTRTGRFSDLQAAIDQVRQGVDAYQISDPRRPGGYSNLAGAIRRRYEYTGEMADLNEAIELGRTAIESGRENQRALMLASLSGSLRLRFRHSAKLADLQEAIEFGQAAVRAAPAANVQRRSALSMLAAALQLHFEATGSLDSLTQSVECQREGIGMLPATHPEAAIHHIVLATSLQGRYERMGVAYDLEQAISVGRRACHLAQEDLVRSQAAAVLAMLLKLRAKQCLATGDRQGGIANCDEALLLTERSVVLTSLQHESRIELHIIQGNIHMMRYQLSREPDDYRSAIVSYEVALGRETPNNRHHIRVLGNIGYAHILATADREAPQLDAAITALRQAVDQGDSLEPAWAQAASNLTVALCMRYRWRKADCDRDEALSICRQVDTAPGASTVMRAGLANIAAELSMSSGDSGQATPFYRTAVELLPTMAWIGTDRATRQSHLTDASEISRDAAACLVANGDDHLAIERLEQGRGILWTQLLQLRQEDSDLQRMHPHLAERLRTLAAGMNS
jgi:tetratricopeptide (TPR) repeat protein